MRRRPGRPSLVALLTDFGDRDPYAGILRGVLAARAPLVRTVDLCHGLPPGDVAAAALALRQAVPHFPEGTLFVCVVDPGVGSSRKALWARSARASFLAPDNGLLSWLPEGHELLERRSLEAFASRRPLSGTFHGRDLFAPAAAALCRGLSPSRLGPPLERGASLPWPGTRRAGARLASEIVGFDRFGNALTSLPAERARGRRVLFRGRDLGPVRPHYAAGTAGRPLAVAGSSGLVELAVRDGSFERSARARAGEAVHAKRA